MNIKYPILNISLPKWNEDIVEELFREDDIYQSNNESFFNDYLLEQKFVDSNGYVYILTNKEAIKSMWPSFLVAERSRIHFKEAGEKISFNELKQLMIERVNDLNGDEAKEEWISRLETKQTIQELIEG